MEHIFASQNGIGRLADERIYKSDVAQRLAAAGINSEIETPIKLIHKTFVKKLWLDLVVSRRAVYELKTVSALNLNHVAQLLTYLYLLDLPRGKLVNFRSASVESKFVNAPIPREERCGFKLIDDSFHGDRNLLQLVVELVRDWGTSLSVSLYHQAMVHLLGGETVVERMLPLARHGKNLGNQRFHLQNSQVAFELTGFANLDNEDYRGQLQRLLDMSPLSSIEWINIGPHCITFNTLQKT